MDQLVSITKNYIETLSALYESGMFVQLFISDNIIEKILGLEGKKDVTEKEFIEKLKTLSREQKQLFSRFSRGIKLLPKSFLVSAVSIYDSFVSKVIESILVQKDEIPNSLTFTFSFLDIKSFSSIEEIQKHIIRKEIDGLMRESHIEHLKWIEKKFDLNITEKNNFLPTFIEITERRNLFVHSDGIVNSYYLKNCKQHKVNVSGLSEGKGLDCNQEYFSSSIKSLKVFGVILSQTIWRKVFPSEHKKANGFLIELTYNLILDREYETTIEILEYFISILEKQFDQEEKIILKINLAQSYKWLKKNDEMKKVLSDCDWSVYNSRYYIAYLTLIEKWDDLEKMLSDLRPTDELNALSFKEWPLFKRLREREFFSTWIVKFSRKRVDKKLLTTSSS